MRSRVKKNQALHQDIATNSESSLENSNIGDYANRLNQIDENFKKIETHEKRGDSSLSHARQNEVEVKVDSNESQYDTFESTYLKDFLNEVKDYNVEKGIRSTEDTQANILESFNLKQDRNTFKFEPETFTEILNEVDPVEALIDHPVIDLSLLDEVVEEDVLGDSIDMSIFEFPVDEDIALEVVDHEVVDQEAYKELENKMLEETQTLQIRIIEQERHMEELNDAQDKQSRLLNIVFSMLIFAIIVVILLILSNL